VEQNAIISVHPDNFCKNSVQQVWHLLAVSATSQQLRVEITKISASNCVFASGSVAL